jgi:hypothetical protein
LQFLGCRQSGDLFSPVGHQDMADQRGSYTFGQLRLFFTPAKLVEVGDSIPQTPWDFSSAEGRQACSLGPRKQPPKHFLPHYSAFDRTDLSGFDRTTTKKEPVRIFSERACGFM